MKNCLFCSIFSLLRRRSTIRTASSSRLKLEQTNQFFSRSLTPLFSVFAVMFLSGCLMTRDQIREGASSGTQAEITDMQVKRAEEQAKLDEMEESLRNLTGQIEIVQNQLRMMEAQKMAAAGQASEGEEKPMSAAEVKQKFLLFEEALRSMELRLNTLTEELKKVKAAPRAASRKAAPKKELGNYAGAQKDFDKKSWKKAIVGYEKYRELNPKGKRYADATYKIGVCFQELGMKSEAKAFYEEVVAKFPKSNTSNKAKYRLSKLK